MNATNQKTTKPTANNDDETDIQTELIKRKYLEGNIQERTASLESAVENPFRPRMSLTRSPARDSQPCDTIQPCNEEEVFDTGTEELEIEAEPEDILSSQGTTRTPHEINITLDTCLEAYADIMRYLQRAKTAMMTIHEYAKNTKNVKSLLKEKSGLALNAMVNMSELLDKLKVEAPPVSMERVTQGNKNPGGNVKSKLHKMTDAYTQTDPRARQEHPDGRNKRDEANQTSGQSRGTPQALSCKRKQISPILQSNDKKQRVKDTAVTLPNKVPTERTGVGMRNQGDESDARPREGAQLVGNPVVDETNMVVSDNETWETIKKRRGKKAAQDQAKGIQNNESRNKVEGKRMGNSPPLRQKGEALSIKMTGTLTFAEIVNKMKAKVGEEPQGIKGMRRSQNGNLLIEFSKGVDSTDLFKKLHGDMGEECVVRRLVPRVDIEIMDIDPTVEEVELRETLCKTLNIESMDIRVKMFRGTSVGLKRALVEIPTKALTKVESKNKIKIGWTLCRYRITTKITRCFKCHEIGHMAGNCPLKQVDEIICRKCGQKGHKIGECTGTPRCILCTRRARTGDLNHIAGSYRCPVFGEAKKTKEAQVKKSNG